MNNGEWIKRKRDSKPAYPPPAKIIGNNKNEKVAGVAKRSQIRASNKSWLKPHAKS